MAQDPAVIVIGGGMAGLAAACELGRAGLSVCILEARERLGGRVFTWRDPACDVPLELGAEFIHGRAHEILDPLKKAKLKYTEVSGDSWCVYEGKLSKCDFFSDVDSILGKMDDSSPDESFQSFLERCFPHPRSASLCKAKERATAYVSGFNAADPRLVGVHWLVQEIRAEERIEGDRAFRLKSGYQSLLNIFLNKISQSGVNIRTATVVRKVKWRKGIAEVAVRDAKGSSILEAPRILITLPLSLLKTSRRQAGVVQFTPELPKEKLNALGKLEMGKVIRVALRFRERFWDSIKPPGATGKNLSNMSFLLSQDKWFPTWWTTMPRKSPVITGWAPFRAGERLSGKSRSFVVEQSLRSLGELLRMSQKELGSLFEDAYFHDWQRDPFSRGAYSYGKVGAVRAQAVLAEPLKNTLFFAGEATDTSGNNGTVHGAIASGYRAARQILQNV